MKLECCRKSGFFPIESVPGKSCVELEEKKIMITWLNKQVLEHLECEVPPLRNH
ncbi:hypothetical protein I79_011338 [Cricetulus griseus]|uniref:Uncharacterized protein n=1 Tax=Cricetulus griseus TaxID=10029 RepID=G3HKV6_CRIGR|nr:hypothetical protein I79_011338 [Cricetulus griseus]